MDEKTDGNAIKNPYIRIGAVAVFLAVLLFLFHGGRYSGLGTNLISAAFENGTIYGYDWILKLGFTVLTLAIGFQGGEVTPLFSILGHHWESLQEICSVFPLWSVQHLAMRLYLAVRPIHCSLRL